MGIDFRAFSYFSTNTTNEQIIDYIYKYFKANGFDYYSVDNSFNTYELQLKSIALNQRNDLSIISSNRSSLHFVIDNLKDDVDFPINSNIKLLFLILDADYINTTKPSEGQELLEVIVKGLIKFHLDHRCELSWAGYSEEMFTYNTINSGVIEEVYWFNIIGKKYVESIGKDILIKAPGWQIEELNEGSVLIRLSAHPHIYEKKENIYLHEYLGLDYCN